MSKFKVGDFVEYIGDLEEDSRYISRGVHKVVGTEERGMYLDYDPDNLWFITSPNDTFRLYEEDRSEFADDVVITARYSIEIKGKVIEDLNFSELCVLRDALNKIVEL